LSARLSLLVGWSLEDGRGFIAERVRYAAGKMTTPRVGAG